MENTDSIVLPFFFTCVIIIIVTAYLVSMIRSFILAWKHDSYVWKTTPQLALKESVSPFGGIWNGITAFENLFSKTNPDEYILLLRKKIRFSMLCTFLSLSLLPAVFFLLVVLIMGMRYMLGYSW